MIREFSGSEKSRSAGSLTRSTDGMRQLNFVEINEEGMKKKSSKLLIAMGVALFGTTVDLAKAQEHWDTIDFDFVKPEPAAPKPKAALKPKAAPKPAPKPAPKAAPKLRLEEIKPFVESPMPSAQESIGEEDGTLGSDVYEAQPEVFEKIEKPQLSTATIAERAAYYGSKVPSADAEYRYRTRLMKGELEKFFELMVESEEDLEALLLTKEGLTPAGEELFEALVRSEDEGLLPGFYHVGRIYNLLESGDLKKHKSELVELLAGGGLSYLRDLTAGMPEMKRADREWLLEGRKVNVVTALRSALISDESGKAIAALAPQYREYQELKAALAAFREKNLQPDPAKIAAGSTLRAGMAGERVQQLRARLNYFGYEAGEGNSFDETLDKAVRAFQKAHLLEPDGAAGKATIAELNRSYQDRIEQVEINLERWRWMPGSMGADYIAVDIPGFRYYVVKDGEEVLSAKTVVGRGDRQTPVFMSPMNHIVFSPYWHVPRSMAVRDFLPRLKRDPNALKRSRIRVFRGGQEVDPNSVNWQQYHANNFPFQLRQDPGDYNSLGRVKFMFPNEHAIYLHDTPSRHLFGKTSRDFSSGCVRIENPSELAEFFLKDLGWDRKKIEAAYKRDSEAYVKLQEEKRIPVYTLYMTTRTEGDSISFRADIYNKDKPLIDVLRHLKKSVQVD